MERDTRMYHASILEAVCRPAAQLGSQGRTLPVQEYLQGLKSEFFSESALHKTHTIIRSR